MKPEVRGWLEGLGGRDGTGVRVLRTLDSGGESVLETYGEWLVEEGIPAGLLSPTEAGRIAGRHIEDSLGFLVAWPERAPTTLHDAGSGGGLPGIPLAVVLPDTQVVLVERSERRSRLLRRASRVLELANVEVQTRDLHELRGCEAIVMRAVLPIPEAALWMNQALRVGGAGVVALSRRHVPDPGWAETEGTVAEAGMLDPPGWLLIIRKREH